MCALLRTRLIFIVLKKQITILKAILELLDEDAPVILWCMDYNFFRQLTTNGDLATINRSEDGKFHVNCRRPHGHPLQPARDMLAELNRIVEACGTTPVMILESVPRFLIRSCCINN